MREVEEPKQVCAFQIIYHIIENVKTGIFSSKERTVDYEIKCGLIQEIDYSGECTWGDYNHECKPEICPLYKLLGNKTDGN